jgi:hypothetical protein
MQRLKQPSTGFQTNRADVVLLSTGLAFIHLAQIAAVDSQRQACISPPRAVGGLPFLPQGQWSKGTLRSPAKAGLWPLFMMSFRPSW